MMLKSSLHKLLCTNKKAYERKAMEGLCNKINHAAHSSINGKVIYGFIKKLLKEPKEEEHWFRGSLILFALRNYCRRIEDESNQAATELLSINTIRRLIQSLPPK